MIWEKRWFQLSALMLLAFIWGSSFILMKTGLKSFGADQAGALRIVMAYWLPDLLAASSPRSCL